MMVFDVASDTILYCAMLDIMENELLGGGSGLNQLSGRREQATGPPCREALCAPCHKAVGTGVVELLELIDSVSSWWSSSSSESCGE